MLRREFVEERIELLVPTLYDLCCLFLVERENVFLRRNNRLRDEEEGIGKRESDEIKKANKTHTTRTSARHHTHDPRRRSKSCCDTSTRHSRGGEYRPRTSDEDDHDEGHHVDVGEHDCNGDDNEDNIDNGDEEQEEAEELAMRKWERVLPLDIKEKLRLDYKRCGNPSCRHMGFFFGEGRVKRRFVERERLIAEQREREEARRCRAGLDFASGPVARLRLTMSADATPGSVERQTPFPFVGAESKWVCWSCRYENSGLLATCALCRDDRDSRTTSTLSLLPRAGGSSSSSSSTSALSRGGDEGEKAREREMRRRQRDLQRRRGRAPVDMLFADDDEEGEEEEAEEDDEQHHHGDDDDDCDDERGKQKEVERDVVTPPSSPLCCTQRSAEFVVVRQRRSGGEDDADEEEERRRRYQRAELKAELTLSFCSPDCAAVLGRFLARRATGKKRSACEGKRARVYSHSQPQTAQATLPRPRTRRMGVFGAHHG
jgi:hypothetical protein